MTDKGFLFYFYLQNIGPDWLQKNAKVYQELHHPLVDLNQMSHQCCDQQVQLCLVRVTDLTGGACEIS